MNNEERRTMEILRNDNQELAKTITSLKRQIGGYKKSNAEYREKVKKLTVLCREGDELYEGKITEMEQMQKKMLSEIKELTNSAAKASELEQTILRKDTYIESLQSRVQELTLENADLDSALVSKKALIDEMDRTIEELRKPWWRRIL